MANRRQIRGIYQTCTSISRTTSCHPPSHLRQFTSSAVQRKHGALPSLDAPPTSAPELLDLLREIRTKIFLPSHLKIPQKRLVYKRKYWNVLRNDPVTVDIGTESHTLEPIDRTKDVPNAWKSLLEAIRLMGDDAETWRSCYVDLLKGYKTAGFRLQGWKLEHVVRKAGEKGMVGCVVDAATMGADTGILLGDVRMMRAALWGCRMLMLQGAGHQAQALQFAERLAEQSEQKLHTNAREKGTSDPRVQPDCIAILVELAAKCGDEQKTVVYVSRLLSNLEKNIGNSLDQEEELLKQDGRLAALADYELMRWVPVLKALDEASSLLGSKMPDTEIAKKHSEQLQRKIADIRQTINSSDDPKKDSRMGLRWSSA